MGASILPKTQFVKNPEPARMGLEILGELYL